ncbi:MAG: tetratricopeptide repeat protein [Myxococcota bacterium]|jgi:Flp pilus assembly protein TadD/uncharacterized protein (AIM24 family)
MASTARGRDPAVEEEFLGALYKGGELLAAGKIVEAREHLEKAHQLEPKNEKAQNLLGLTYFKLGLYDDAARVYEFLVRENPVDPTLRVNLGLVYLKTNALDRCIKELETATDLDPAHQKAHNYLGLALAQAGEYARAREHFHAAGSEAMAEKMTRALVARAEAAADDGPGMTVSTPPPATAQASTNAPAKPLEAAAAPPPPPPPPLPSPPSPPTTPDDASYDVMSDEEVPSDAFAVPEEATMPAPPPSGPKLDSDWGAQFASAPPPAEPPAEEELRLAEDEGPSSAVASDAMPVLDASAVQVEATTIDTRLAQAVHAEAVASAGGVVEAAVEETEALPSEPLRVTSAAPAWLTMEAAEAANALPETQWVTEGLGDVPMPTPQAGIEAEVSWGAEAAGEVPADPAWANGFDGGAAPAERAYEPPAEASYAQPAEAAYAPPTDAASVQLALGPSEQHPAYAEAAYPDSTEMSVYAASYPETVSYDAGAAAEAPYAEAGGSTKTASDAEQAYAAPPPATEAAGPDDASFDAAFADAPAGAETGREGVEASAGPIPPLEFPPTPATDFPPPNPSGPDLPIEVAPPVRSSALPPGPTAAPGDVPEGYTAMRSQRLVDIGAASGWVREPSAGPFHMSPEGLAVTVNGEMLSRMTGLVAVVGSLDVKPEVRRKRGRPTPETFGSTAAQLQRIAGNGVLYLEPGRHRFFAVDLTDTNGASVDDDGAYVREDAVFAFEESVGYENGRITGEGLALELVHLKGTGKALLQLDGTMKAMPIPPGAPMVVPLKRLVGWFGRVTPRLMGFGGQGAVELKGDGYALLETPGERA